MAKRKITISVDEELVDAVQQLGGSSPSGMVNAVLTAEVDRRVREAALGRLLSDWEAELGPVPEEAVVAARNAFDDVDVVAPPNVGGRALPAGPRQPDGDQRAT